MFKVVELLRLIPKDGAKHGVIKKLACGDPKVDGDTGFGMTEKQFNDALGDSKANEFVEVSDKGIYKITDKGNAHIATDNLLKKVKQKCNS